MRTAKKLLSLVLASAVVLAMGGMTVFAAPEDELILGYPDGDFYESDLYNAIREEAGVGDGQPLTKEDAAKVTSLDLSGMDLLALTGLEHCTGLTSLDLSGNSQVVDLHFLENMTSLTDLDISGTSVANLSFLPDSIETLNLSGNTVVNDLSDLPSSLTSLNISGCTSVRDVCDAVTLPNGLTHLDMSDIGSIQDITSLPTSITWLDASGNSINDLSGIASMTGLEYLDLSDNMISSIPDLSSFNSLSTLNLQGNGLSEDDLTGKLPTGLEGKTDDILGTDPAPSVDTTELKSTIAEAKAKLEAVVISEDGTDVYKSTQWVTQEVYDALQTAIEAAQGVVDNPTDADTVAAQVTALTEAISTFDDAKESGTAAVDTTALKEQIEAAKKLYNDTKESKDGADVYEDETWATAANRATFNTAIEAAEAALGTAADASDVTSAVNALLEAISTFNNARDFGSQARPSTPGTGSGSGSGSSSSSSSSRKPERLLAGWDGIVSRALHADPGDTVSFDMTGEKYVPASLIEALQESGATLELEYRGNVYTITGDSVEVDSGRIYWPVADFLDLLQDAPATAEEAPAEDGEDVSTANPDTGAHDGVGLAVALAALSLAAAGVVSLRK